ncbi:MAG: ornithine carbamoyltransferase [Nocardioides sp.]
MICEARQPDRAGLRHFLRDDDLTPTEQAEVLALASKLKADPYGHRPLAGPHTVATIYDKPTLRTQASFAAAIAELGGHPMLIDGALAGIGVRESVADVARVLGRQASLIVWRTFEQDKLAEMSAHAGVPVVNALTDDFHPCQLLADLLTITEHCGELAGQVVTFLGDGACNMGNSWVLAGTMAGMQVRISSPPGFDPAPACLDAARALGEQTGGTVTLESDPVLAAEGADVLVTDTWVSMGKEEEAADRASVFAPYQLDERLLGVAADPIVMHCLPAYRGKEISGAVLDGPRSVVWDEAENRRHAQKAVIAWLVRGDDEERKNASQVPAMEDR